MEKEIPIVKSIDDLRKALLKNLGIHLLKEPTLELSKTVSHESILDFLTSFIYESNSKSQISSSLRLIGSLEKSSNYPFQKIVPFLLSKDPDIHRSAIHAFAKSTSKEAEKILIQNIKNISQNWQKKYVVRELVGISKSTEILRSIIDIYENTRVPDLKNECIDAIQLLALHSDNISNTELANLLIKSKVSSIGQLKYKSYKRITLANWAIAIHDFVLKSIKKKKSRGLNFNTYYLLDLNNSFWLIIRANYFYNPDNEIRGFTLYTNYYSKFVTTTERQIIDAPRGGKDFKGQLEDLLGESNLRNEFLSFLSKINKLSDYTNEISFKEYCQLIPEGYRKPNLYIGHLEGYVNFLIKNDLKFKILQQLEEVDPEFMPIDNQQKEYLLNIQHDH